MTNEFEIERVAGNQLVNQLTPIAQLRAQNLCHGRAPAVEALFPCRSDEEIRAGLRSIFNKTQIEVAGGIIRHDIR